MIRLLFLHGIFDGGLAGEWKIALRDGLQRLDYPVEDFAACIVAPQYTEYLAQDPAPRCSMPKVTATELSRDQEMRERCAYERRQASLERLLELDDVQNGSGGIPELPKKGLLRLLAPAHRYVRDPNLRACILRRVRDRLVEVSVDGEIVIVGHSLGSLVAIDLLDQLPPNIVVRRLVTIGSPAGHVMMHRDQERLLKTFPITRVGSWANIWAALDPVPARRGIAHLFPHALDVRIQTAASLLRHHDAESYLAHPTVANAIGEALYGARSRAITPPPIGDDRPLSEHEAVVVAGLAFGHYLADELGDDRRKQERFRGALQNVQREVIARLQELYVGKGQALPARLAVLADGRRPEPYALVELARAVPMLLSIAEGNVIAPFDIATKEPQRRRALERLAAFLELPRDRARVVCDALQKAQKVVASGNLSWILWTVLGGIIALAAPVGLVVVAPAGLVGGAAIVSALAAFGPGGMVGGILTATALSSVGASVVSAGVVRSLAASSTSPETFEAAVVQQLATAIAHGTLRLRNDGPWGALCELEVEVAHRKQRIEPFSDKKGPVMADLERKAAAVRRALEYLIEEGLSPIPDSREA